MISSSCNKLNPLTAAIQHKIIVIIFVERRKITVYFRNKSHLAALVITSGRYYCVLLTRKGIQIDKKVILLIYG